MNGLMMDYSLTLEKLLLRARDIYPEQEIVSRMGDKSIHRYTFADFYRRVIKLMNALRELGVKPGDRVATFAWNHYRHMELYFAVPCLGAVLHTLNIRLTPEHLTYIINHAKDKLVFADSSLTGPLLALRDQMPSVAHIVSMDDLTPETSAAGDVLDYEALLDQAGDTEELPVLDEQTAAALCYTSGTTGEPKGVLYSHRSMYLHALGLCMADSAGLSMRDAILPVVPLFHVNGWGVPYACCMTGAKAVYPGAHLLGQPLAELIAEEKVTITPGVPSVWFVLYQYLKKSKLDVSCCERFIGGGSAVPQSLIEAFERDLGLKLVHGWGMTETSPTGAFGHMKRVMDDWPEERRYRQRAKQGLPVPMVEMKIVDERGEELPRDGERFGELLIRGPWVARAYYENDSESARAAFTDDGWFRTGDIATLDGLGYMEIVDRKKDLIKTRGEWLSSVEMENTAMGHEAVMEAAVVGRPDDIRGEVVVLFVVPLPEKKDALTAQAICAFLESKFPKWQVPRQQDVRFVDAIPKTSVGKFDKKSLRARL